MDITSQQPHIDDPGNGRAEPAPRVARAEQPPAVVRVVSSPRLIAEFNRARRDTYTALGVTLNDGALDAQRPFGTTLGVFLDGTLIGAFSAWRLSEALCSVGYLLAGLGIERRDPGKVVELASMFMRPEHAKQGYARLLLEAGRVLVAGMKPELLVAFAVRGVADRYINEFGFRPVGAFVRHPLAPSVEIIPLVATYEEFAARHFA